MYKKFLFFIIIFSIGLAFGHSQLVKRNITTPQLEKNTPQAFIGEVYDKIKENYWDNISDASLLNLFKIAFDKHGGNSYVEKFESREKLLQSISSTVRGMDEESRNKFISSVASDVLTSLSPVGRSGLYTTKQEEQLKNTVSNINPEKDLYKDLGLSKGASASAVEQAYEKKANELSLDKSEEAQKKLKELSYSKEVLTNKDRKENYDKKGVEPTIFSKILNSNILYVQFKKFSPTSYDEFIKTFDSYKNNSELTALIFDLRGNIGGSIDAAPYFMGNFIGRGIPAFDFYHKGEYLPFKTQTDKLPSVLKYKQLVVLIDNNSQSSAELMAASFKRYRAGIVIGSTTKGWGTVERVFQLENQFDKKTKYSLFLVHSLTLREDNQPVEGKGVDPDISFKNENWEQVLYQYFRNNELTEAIKNIR